MTEYKLIQAAGTDFIDRVLGGTAWASTTVTFGFTTSVNDYSSKYGIGETKSGYQPFTSAQQAAFREAIAAWGELVNVKFVETKGATADIRAAQSSAPTTGWTYNPGSSAEAGDIWMGTAKGYYTAPKAGNYGYDTFVHELGHALGLEHPHEKNLSGTAAALAAHKTDAQLTALYGADVGDDAIDAMAYSIMSYSSYANDGRGGYTNGTWDYAQSPMLRDIAAVQYMYGANYTTRATDTVYSWDPNTGEKSINGVGQGAPGGNKVFETLWDGGGHDTIDLAAYRSNLSIDLSPGGWSNFGTSQLASLGAGHSAPGNVAIAYLYQGDTRSLIENAVGGSGNDTISGNEGNNLLVGGAGDDRISGLGGNNILAGGSIGNELSLVGLDKADWTSDKLPVISGPDGDDILTGGAGNDIFLPGNGANAVHGKGGNDTLILAVDFDTVAIVKQGDGYLLTYAGGSVQADGIRYLATLDGIHEFGGSAVSGDAGDIGLLYQAGLGREIDAPGLAYWNGEMQAGKTLAAMAPDILASSEFTARFGDAATMTDGDYVQVLYKNVLDRAGETAGIAYWTDALAKGESRADMLVQFAVSDENRDAAQHAAEETGGIDLVAVTKAEWAAHWVA